jgi:hypothetical protein
MNNTCYSNHIKIILHVISTIICTSYDNTTNQILNETLIHTNISPLVKKK